MSKQTSIADYISSWGVDAEVKQPSKDRKLKRSRATK